MPIVVPYYINLFYTWSDRRNSILLMSPLLLVSEAININSIRNIFSAFKEVIVNKTVVFLLLETKN